MQEGVAFGFLILGHKKATLPAQRGAVVAPSNSRTCSGTIGEREEMRSEVHARHEGQRHDRTIVNAVSLLRLTPVGSVSCRVSGVPANFYQWRDLMPDQKRRNQVQPASGLRVLT
jgi:hypothetical protein